MVLTKLNDLPVPFLEKLMSGRRFGSFFVAAAMKRMPSTLCSLFLNSGVSSSVSVVIVDRSIVAATPSVIISWLASSDVFFILVGGTSL